MRMVAICGFYLIFRLSSLQAQGISTPQDKNAEAVSTVPRLTVEGEVMKKYLLHQVNPPYPDEARRGSRER
jgi:hypothetical protein